MAKLTKRFVDTLHPDPTGKDVFVWDTGDGSLKGFGVRIKRSGVASYLVQYRNKEGRTRRLVLGKVGVLTPDDARKAASDKLKSVAGGNDPSAERHSIRKSITVADLCDLYLKDAEGRIKSSTLKMDKSRVECHVKPLLGNLSVRSLTFADIERFQTNIGAGKTAKKRKEKGRSGSLTGGRGVAARTVGMLGTILEFARRRKIIIDNPARGVQKFEDNKHKRFLSFDEITALGSAMRDTIIDEKNPGNKTGIAAIRVLLLTGCRKNEILALPWEWFDAKARCIRFGDTKSGAQLRPIGASAVEHLKAQPKCEITTDEYSPWIFPANRGDGHFIGLPKVFERLCEKAKIKGATLHSLRHTFAACAAELGFSELTIAGLLGHTVSGVTARYAHVADSALLSAADRVASHIARALDGKVASAEVVSINSNTIQQGN